MKIALVLQGGGSRGIYTSAILDSILKEEIKIDKIIGVSAGALNGMNFLSNQIGRGKETTLICFDDKKFFSFRNLLTKKSIVNLDYYFNEANETVPFDNNKYINSKIDLEVVATSLKTGLPTYFSKKDFKGNFNNCIKASASLPIVSRKVFINNDYFLDGGFGDPIPFERAIKEGYKKIIVVSTRPFNYTKEVKEDKFFKLSKIIYRKYPNFLKTYKNYPLTYNKRIKKLTNNKDLFIIAPSEQIYLGDLEKDKEKIEYYYELGLKDFKNIKKDLMNYITKS